MVHLKKLWHMVRNNVHFLEVKDIVSSAAAKAKDRVEVAADVVAQMMEDDYTGLLVLDYDRTMIAHDYPDWFRGHADFYSDVYHMLVDKDALYAKDKPVPAVVWYAENAYRAGHKIICLSQELSNLRDSVKRETIAKEYAGMCIEYYSVATPELKIPFIKAYADAKGIPLRSVTMVDANMSTVNLAMENKIHGIHLSSVVADYESMGAGEE